MIKNRKLSDKEIKKIVEEVKATLALENLDLTDEELEVARRYAKGELTEDEAFKALGVKNVK